MNDRYLFRAKWKNWRELPKEEQWVQGYYVFCRRHHYILPVVSETLGYDERYDEWVEIDESTLCQCTGSKDKNGTLIWENDVVRWWFNNICSFVLYQVCGHWNHMELECFYYEVIGNIFDNPELLKVEQDGE